jgi:hypothetical protein
MRRLLIATSALAAAFLVPLSGNTNDTALHEADLAWERGDYIGALTVYAKLLESSDAERVLQPIALQTGELFKTHELTTDGAAPQFSPDGRFITYETGVGLKKTVRIVRGAAPFEVIAELPGTGASFSPDSLKLAYLRLASPSQALQDAQAALDKAQTSERQQRQAAVTRLLASEAQIAVRDLKSGDETAVDTGNVGKTAVRLAAAGAVLFAGTSGDGDPQLYLLQPFDEITARRPPVPMTTGPGDKVLGDGNRQGTAVLYTVRPRGRGGRGGGRAGEGRGDAEPPATPERQPGNEQEAGGTDEGRGGGRGGGRGEGSGTFGIISLPDGKAVTATGSAPVFSADGQSLAFISRQGSDLRLMAGSPADPAKAAVVRSGTQRVDAPAFTADGQQIALQMMGREDWEIYVISRDGKSERRLTREIQHDVLPKFLSGNYVLGAIGEARHRRSYLYNLESGERIRLFHNNTVRTIAPEYAWVADATGTRILISAERDGDTVSLERGIYLVDLTQKVTVDEVRARIQSNLAAEKALLAKGQRLFAPIAPAVKEVVARASVDRVFAYEEKLFSFDSKHITQPGNKLAGDYLFETYKSFGYQPEYQTFAPRNALGGKTSNILATLRGTVNPELVYVVSSHYDSSAAGPGADDDSSGTAALLETARIMADRPQPATIVFASFTGEEAGLLGSREFVRQAVEKKIRIVGALNNDTIGWANDQRLDNTIRYSNAGIRDIQHGAAQQFTNLILYDTRYFKSTDAAALYEAFGDIIGGIGSYPVLASPHYHQSHDVLETINHRLVTEVAKTTAATLMLLAASPSRLTDLKAERSGGAVTLSWKPSPEAGVTGYIVSYGPADNPGAQQLRVSNPSATLKGVPADARVAVKAVNAKGLESWDAARVVVP